jgi:RHS repeat-associated protein
VRTQVERGLETDHDWDLAGRLTDVTMSTAADGVLATSAAAYDVASNNVSVTDPNGNLIEFEFDALNRVVLERDGEGNEVGWGYDERSLLERRTNARHVPVTAPSQLTFTYDAAERRIQTAGQEPGYSWTIDDTLDANGNATASTGASTDPARAPATVSRSFDALDQEAARTVELTAGLQRTVTSEYDELGNLAAVIYSDGTTRVDYTYDALNRITSVTYSGAGPAQQTTYEYDAVDNVTRVVQPDGSETLFSYDLADRPTEITDQVGGNVLFGAQFTLDAAGRRVAAELQLPLQPTLETDETFAYDAANRLVTRGGSEALVYDADGNLVSGRIGGTTRSLSYNAKNQLVGFDGDVYRYDADGNCVARSSGAVTTYYLYDSLGRLVEELDATGAVIARYVHGLGLISRQAGAATSIYHYDSRGSTVALTDLSGAITDRYAYTPFGGVQLDAANATPNRFTYGGRDGVFDEGNGLYATRSRHYAPELMRFVQKDKVYAGRVDGPQSMNRYAFVEGNPIERIDPTGAKGIGSALKIARRAAKKANKSETMGEKLRSEAFDQFAAEYLTKEGYTAEQVGYVCDKVGGGVCDWLGGADRYVSGLFKPVYAAAHGVIFGAQREVMDAACDVTDLPYCDELGSGVRWFQDLIAENVQETLDAGLFGFFAEERDTLVGLWETGHEVYLSLVDLISPRAGDALREIEEIARDIFESIF